MMRNIEAHPEEYIDEHIEKLNEFRDYVKLGLHDYLSYAHLMDKACNKRYVVFLRVINWFIKYLEGQVKS